MNSSRKPVLQDSYDPLTRSAMHNLETRLRFVFPPSYHEFLLAHNGGSFPKQVVFVSPRIKGLSCAIGEFLGIGTGDHADMESVLRICDNIERFVPIANDPGGSLICFMRDDTAAGRLYYVDISSGYCELDFLADSFQQFLENIDYVSDPELWQETQPAFAAVEAGDTLQIATFLDAGIGVDSHNERGDTLLMIAARNRQGHVAAFLLANGSDPNRRNALNRTALHFACESDSADSVTALLDAGADPNTTDNQGNAPLHIAVNRQSIRVIQKLVTAGADVSIRNHNGESASDWVKRLWPDFKKIDLDQLS